MVARLHLGQRKLESAAKSQKEDIIRSFSTSLIHVGLRDSQKRLVLPLLKGIWKSGEALLVFMVIDGGRGY